MERANKASMTYRIIMDKHAGLNPNAHRSFGLDFNQIDDLIRTSPKLVGDLKLIEMCSQSDGACCVIFACEKKAKRAGQDAGLDTRPYHRSQGRNFHYIRL
ncbi:MAG: hypothetical protein MZW92_34025 [Comamonadaceae bacterium]|nr:hypothetical protein [Comamonadaceae bacterium]